MSHTEKKSGAEAELPSWLEKVLEKGGDVNVCLTYLRDRAEKEEKIRLKEIEHEMKLKADEADRAEKEAECAERAAVRAEKAAERAAEEKEKERQLKILQLETEKELKLKELDVRSKELTSKPEIKSKVSLPKFDENQDIEVFLTSFERLAELHKWPKEQWPVRLVPQLTGKALEAYSRMAITDSNSYDKIKRAILERFGLNPLEYRNKFRKSKQLPDETFKEYAIRVCRYFEHWKDSEEVKTDYSKLADLIIRDQLLSSCSFELQIYLQEKETKTVEDLVALANAHQLAHKNKEPRKQLYKPPMFRNQSRETYQNTDNSSVGGVSQASKVFEKRRCFVCDSEDHLIAKCPFKANNSERKETSDTKDKDKQAHGLIHSPTKHEMNYRTVEIPFQGVQGNGVESVSLTNGLMISDGTIGINKVKVLRDTGCTTVFISEALSREGKKTGKFQDVTLANGTTCRCPEVIIPVDTCYISGNVKALIMDNPFADLVIGNVGHVKVDQNKGIFQAVETRAIKDKRLTEEALQSKVEKEILSERNRIVKETHDVVPKEKKNEVDMQDQSVDLSISKDKLREEQEKDESLANVREYAMHVREMKMKHEEKKRNSYFTYENSILYRVFVGKSGESTKQIVVPREYRNRLMAIAHDIPLGGHLGNKKTRERLLQNFFWPGIFIDVAKYCRTCSQCQKNSKKGRVYKAPLISIPPMDEPFSRIAIDIVGPLIRSEQGNRYILVACDYGTKYPEAIPLKTIDAETVAYALVDMFSRTGIPREILSDQGSNFMSALMQNLCSMLGIRKLKTTPYHPQANGLVENFNGTLKRMLKCYSNEELKTWDKNIPYLLFAYREAKHESTGFSPFELLYARHVRGPLSIIKEEWEEFNPDEEQQSSISFILDARERLQKMTALARSNENKEKKRQKKYFDKKCKRRELKVHDKVLILLPTSTNKLLAEYKGPYEIVEKVSPVDYRVKLNRQTLKVFHINMMKKWHERQEEMESDKSEYVEENSDVLKKSTKGSSIQNTACCLANEEDFEYTGIENPLLVPHETVSDVNINKSLSEKQMHDMQRVCKEFEDVLTDIPGRTTLIEHSLVLKSEKPVYKRPYAMPYALRKQVEDEVKNMLSAKLIEKSNSAYGAPIVVVQKKDKTIRLCIDYRGLNDITVFDPQPMPKLDDIFNKLGKAKFISKIDCTKGFWQIPLEQSAKERSAFVTPFGHYQFNVMPFGMVNSGATFVRLMKMILEGLEEFSDAFIDDVIIFSGNFPEHVEHLRCVLQSFRNARITAKPSKTLLGYHEIEFLAHIVGNGKIQPTEDKIEGINKIAPPATKKQVRSFIGTINFYRRFIPHFAEIATPLTDLTTKGRPNKVRWLPEHKDSFDQLKNAITKYPVLRTPDFLKIFYLQTDASNRGIGAVLMQEENNLRFPVMYISKKLNSAEIAYSTIEKECLAIIKSIQKLREYLLGREFIIECDHFPLQWLNKAKDNNMRLLRWSLVLQEYKFKIHHIPGSKNAIADLLSRFIE